ncbi:MAG: bacillithiol biosynthesis cysteine-adding enzyme BshC [Brevibacillus sp.]|nr:bacillithiol biosynthesis cysteine-adding enzyme BshC [Brevibacillus sp.]
MKIENILLPVANRLTDDYLAGDPQVMRLFTYQPFQPSSYRKRLAWLKERNYPQREQLAEGLLEYNRRIGNAPAALEAIEKLRETHTYVVVGGQQPGVLTGPLYTVHKAVSLIQTARRLTAELGCEVVPVFWIAGEDHDLDEMNHLYIPIDETRMKKQKLDLPAQGRVSASMLQVDRDAMHRFAAAFFAEHAETTHTAELRRWVSEAAEMSTTLADWFARLMARLFGRHGLILLESSLPFVRKLEQPVFRDVLLHNRRIGELLRRAEEEINRLGYPSQLELASDQAHLFLYDGGERQLLRTHDGYFTTKDGGRRYSLDDLLMLLEADPERFSANVVTRPLMQEHLLPTLAFVGGPSEIAYWAFYKAYFAHFGVQMPVVQPRFSLTFLDGAAARLLEGFGLRAEEALRDFKGWKESWFNSLPPSGISERFERVRQSIRQLYQPLVDEVSQLDRGLSRLANKNLRILLDQVTFLKQRTERSILARHQTSLKRIERIETVLLPLGALQERTYNIFSFLNKHGSDLIDRLLEVELPFDAGHKVVYL